MPDHVVTEEVIYFEPESRLSWQEGGSWPHSTHGGFAEALVAAHFVSLGYYVLQDFCTTSRNVGQRPYLRHSTELLHDVVGDEVSTFLCTEMAADHPRGDGEPDLLVFREDRPNDPKIQYEDPRLWFFVEVKGPGDSLRENQKSFFRKFADRFGADRIRLFRVAPIGEPVSPQDISY